MKEPWTQREKKPKLLNLYEIFTKFAKENAVPLRQSHFRLHFVYESVSFQILFFENRQFSFPKDIEATETPSLCLYLPTPARKREEAI